MADAHARELEGREHKQILDHRDRFSEISYGIMQAWVGFLIVLTLGQFILRPSGLGLETAEFIAVVTTTTAAVFGFGLLVGNFLFPSGGSERRRK
ncbi:hypothetical protein [Phenylobacterium sp.]|uniref:hypothetical protein n=1 Tax=Phenylobacterium sp. TaxID=1871053 RepID=UPI002724BB1D|nr:hypothetical protein [Phenylobacterium sp.]MDO8380377.1 hypothetical protein [Phenylobacterium sp.]